MMEQGMLLSRALSQVARWRATGKPMTYFRLRMLPSSSQCPACPPLLQTCPQELAYDLASHPFADNPIILESCPIIL